MKTNFKKLALMAGVSAAMAGGSMSAHAVIQAVPAPAVLIPLFSNVGGSTSVRIEVPSSVGIDSVVNLFGGPNANASTGSVASSNVAPGLAILAPTASTPAASQLHWYFLSTMSNELADSAFPVSANDVIEFGTAAGMPGMTFTSGSTAPNPANLNVTIPPTATGYLVIVNESAALGGSPSFSFQADAWYTPSSSSSPVSNIPVIPLSDTADNGAGAPSLANNVLEAGVVPGGAPYGDGPIVSPLISGIRLGASNASGAVNSWFRVIDLPINGANATTGETYVVWSDRNGSTNIVNNTIVNTPAISGSTLAYDCNEVNISQQSLSVNRQLTFVPVGATITATATTLAGGAQDQYSLVTGVGVATTTCNTATPAQGGFVRWFAQANPYNVGGLTSAAFQAGVIFRLRAGTTDGYSQFPVDRGFFNAR